MRILILCGDADHNLGDSAIRASMCAEIRELCPRAEITVVSAQPTRAARADAVCVVPPGWRGALALGSAAARSDLVLCGGGGLFQDDDSLVKMPYWGVRVALIRLACHRVVGYALGVGPLRASSSRVFARLAFRCMERISVRDRQAQRIAQPLSRGPVSVVPDPALLLRAADPKLVQARLCAEGVPLDGRPLIGVAPRRWFPPKPRLLPHRFAARLPWRPARTAPEPRRFVELLAEVLDDVVRRHRAHILFLPTYTVAHEGDDRVCENIQRAMSASASTQIVHLDDAALYKGIVGRLAALLGGRMHPTIFAAAVGTPAVGLAYNPKFRAFFDLLGDADRVIEVERFVRERRVAQLSALLNGAIQEGRRPRDRVDALAEQVRAFNRCILAPT